MVDPITARCLLTEDDYITAFQAHFRLASTPVMRFARWFFFGMLVLIGIVALTRLLSPGDSERNRSVAGSMGTIAIVGWVFGLAYTRGWRLNVRKQIRSLPKGELTTAWSIDDEGLACRTTLTESRFGWAVLKKAVEAPSGFLLYQTDQSFRIIPGRAFTSAEAIRRFTDLARAKVPNYVVLGECQFPAKPEPIGLDEL